jgi:hypothetical protein
MMEKKNVSYIFKAHNNGDDKFMLGYSLAHRETCRKYVFPIKENLVKKTNK